MKTIHTQTVTHNFAQSDDLILEATSVSRLIFRPQVHPGGVRGVLIRQKKLRNEEWVDTQSIHIGKLKSGEGIKIELETEQLKAIYDRVAALYSISKKGIEPGHKEYIVAKTEEVIVAEGNKATVIRQLLEKGYSEDFWNTLGEQDPDLATRLSWSQIQKERKQALKEFQESLENNTLDEAYWQNFFYRNQWIFGYGLKYQFLHLLTNQPQYGGGNYAGTGSERGDFLMYSLGENKFTVLIEIKKPQTPLMGDGEYRKGVWKISSELANGIAQLQVNCSRWEQSSMEAQNRDALESERHIYTRNSKGILILGRLSKLDSRDKKNTFEGYRRNLVNPEVLTFDELLERARYIVSHQASMEKVEHTSSTPQVVLEDLPF